MTENQKILHMTALDIMKKLETPVAILSNSLLSPTTAAKREMYHSLLHPSLPPPPAQPVPPPLEKVQVRGEEEVGGRKEEKPEGHVGHRMQGAKRKLEEEEEEGRTAELDKDVEKKQHNQTKMIDVIAKFRESSETLEELDELTERPDDEEGNLMTSQEERNVEVTSNIDMDESDDDTKKSFTMEDTGECRIDNSDSPALHSMKDVGDMQDTQDVRTVLITCLTKLTFHMTQETEQNDEDVSKALTADDIADVNVEIVEEENGASVENKDLENSIELFGPDENPNSPVQTAMSKSEINTSGDGFVHSPIE
eukprot:758481-Hanusia_phi.AAC.1